MSVSHGRMVLVNAYCLVTTERSIVLGKLNSLTIVLHKISTFISEKEKKKSVFLITLMNLNFHTRFHSVTDTKPQDATRSFTSVDDSPDKPALAFLPFPFGATCQQSLGPDCPTQILQSVHQTAHWRSIILVITCLCGDSCKRGGYGGYQDCETKMDYLLPSPYNILL